MKTKNISILVYSLLIGLISLGSWMNTPSGEEHGNEGKQNPNVLFIAIDDLNDWVGFLGGHPNAKTPNMDRLAEMGVAFTNAHTSAPVCGPSRAALLTGMGPHRSGCYQNHDFWRFSEPLADVVSLFGLFRQQGYTTLVGGKIYHHYHPRNIPDQVFENDLDVDVGQFGVFNNEIKSASYTYPFEGLKGRYNGHSHWGPLNEMQSDSLSDILTVDWAMEQLERDFDRPFFMGVGIQRPHVPLTAPERFFELFDLEKISLAPLKEDDLDDIPRMGRELAIASHVEMEGGYQNVIREKGLEKEITLAYLACVAYVDWSVGKVLDALEQSPYADNTIVVLWSDHGWGLRERFHWQKWGLWEDVTRVPMVIAAPGTGRPGSRVNAGVDAMDIYPTLVDLCGLKLPPQELDGNSLVPLLKKPGMKWDEPALTTMGPGNHSLRDERWRYIRWADGSEELYDHKTDPNEWYNLAGNKKYQKQISRLSKWLPETDEPAIRSSLPVKNLYSLESPKTYMTHSQQPGIVGQAVTLKADISSESPEGVILKMGGMFSGISLYVKEKRLCMAVMDIPGPLTPKNLQPSTIVVRAQETLPVGDFSVEGNLAKDGTVSLKVNGKLVGTGKVAGPLSVYPSGEITTGGDFTPRMPSIGDYDQKNSKFRGKIDKLTIELMD